MIYARTTGADAARLHAHGKLEPMAPDCWHDRYNARRDFLWTLIALPAGLIVMAAALAVAS